MTDVSASSLYHKSPLESLVRQSSRRVQHSSRLQPLTPPRQGASRPVDSQGRYPTSPLLHTRFRTSVSTHSSTDNSFIDLQDEESGTVAGQDPYWNRDDESIYSAVSGSPSYSPSHDTPNFAYVVDTVGDHSPTLPPSPTPSSPSTMPEDDRQSWVSHASDGTVQQEVHRESTGTVRETWTSSVGGVDPFTYRNKQGPQSAQVPKVVVSSPMSPNSSYYDSPAPPRSLLAPSESTYSTYPASPRAVQYSVSNFSRPIRPSTMQAEQSKRDVLERNLSTRRHPTPASPPSSSQRLQQHGEYHSNADHPTSFANHQQDDYRRSPSPGTLDSSQYFTEPPATGWAGSNAPAIARSTSVNAVVPNHKPGAASHVPTIPAANIGRSVSTNAVAGPSTPHIRLPNSPPSPRPTSQVSLYSAYSFYQLEDGSRAASPSSPQFPAEDTPILRSRSSPNLRSSSSPNLDPRVRVDRNQSRSREPPAPKPSPRSPTTPDEFLQLGIRHHEANRLAESAACFERAATVDGGCGVGMLMWGLSLRHAWGTTKDEKAGFRWLRRAAEAAVGDLEAAREGQDQKAVQTELVLAIYEVGQCFFHGWGVPQDKKMAVSYFQVAARLGDSDAQQELGYCLANGKGCKKDLKEAAKWYRSAAAQGASTVGLAWIYKPKYT